MLSRYRFADTQQPEESSVIKPQMTSLIDILTILLIFLIKSFSVEGNIITPAADLQLPVSLSEKEPGVTTTLEISGQAVTVEGKTLATLQDVMSRDSLTVPAIYNYLFVEHQKYPDSVSRHEVMIQADRSTEYRVLKRVMYSCSRAGFSDFTVLTLQKE